MLAAILVKENIIHVGAALYCAGFLFRDQIMLRAFVIAGDIVYVAYFYFAPDVPLWGAIFWSVVFTAVNVWMIAGIIADRTELRMSDEEHRLFGLLEGLSPGEFRRLMKIGHWQTAKTAAVITRENEVLERLYYVLDGDIVIDKAGNRISIGPKIFIGEVAFLLSRPASATVTLGPGARYVVWERAQLRRLMLSAPSLAIAMGTALNRDMAAKVARA